MQKNENGRADKPIVLITGAAGDIGSALAEALAHDYTVVGLDRPGRTGSIPLIGVDLSSSESVRERSTSFASATARESRASSISPRISTSPARTIRSTSR